MEKSRMSKTRFLDSLGAGGKVEETKIWKPYLGPPENLNQNSLISFL